MFMTPEHSMYSTTPSTPIKWTCYSEPSDFDEENSPDYIAYARNYPIFIQFGSFEPEIVIPMPKPVKRNLMDDFNEAASPPLSRMSSFNSLDFDPFNAFSQHPLQDFYSLSD